MVHAENGSIISKKEELYRNKNLKDPRYLVEVRNEQVNAFLAFIKHIRFCLGFDIRYIL